VCGGIAGERGQKTGEAFSPSGKISQIVRQRIGSQGFGHRDVFGRPLQEKFLSDFLQKAASKISYSQVISNFLAIPLA
jgi:hypothetical protein